MRLFDYTKLENKAWYRVTYRNNYIEIVVKNVMSLILCLLQILFFQVFIHICGGSAAVTHGKNCWFATANDVIV